MLSCRAMSTASTIKLIVSDVDGVWTDGRIIYLGDQREAKVFHVRDGLAVKLAQKCGIPVALLTSRRSPALERRARELGIVELHQGEGDKLQGLHRITHKLGVALDHVLYAGDDLPDLAPMACSGISAAPADAAPEVLRLATWRLESRGGQGAFRELVERLLRERGEWEAIVQDFSGGRSEASSI
jgi:3-deoxy-D-manno-octulosonate 8-phosphate phosphatase (KDO 8-P phosphatase)